MFKSGLWLATSQVLVLLSVPYLSRAYSIEAFSSFAVFSAFFVIASSLCNLRLTDAIVVEDKQYLTDLIGALRLVTFFLSCLIGCIYAFFVGYAYYGFLLAVAIIFFTQIKTQNMLDVREERYSRASLWLASVNIGTVFSQVALAKFDGGLILGQVVALAVVACASLFWGFGGKMESSLGRVTDSLARNKSFAVYLSLYSLVGGIRSKLVYFLLGGGVYSGVLVQAERITNAPNTLISGVLRPVIYGTYDKDSLSLEGESVLGGLVFLMACVAWPFIVLLGEHSRLVVELVMGDKWGEFHNLFFLAAVSSFFFLWSNWMDRVFDILRLQKIAVTVELCLGLVYVGGLFYITMRYSEKAAAELYLFLNALSGVIWMLVVYIVCGYGLKKFLSRISVILVYMFVSASLILILGEYLAGYEKLLAIGLMYMIFACCVIRYHPVVKWILNRL